MIWLRVLLWLSLASYPATVLGVVTSDESGSHVTQPGERSFGVLVEGVALLAADVPESHSLDDLIPLCTGALISDRHIIYGKSSSDFSSVAYTFA